MKWLYVVLCGLLAIGFIYFLSGDEAPTLIAFPEELIDEPDALIEGFEISQFDERGIRTHVIVADRARHFASEGQTEISGLHMSVFLNGVAKWQLSASTGTYHERAADPYILLQDDVVLWSTEVGESKTKFSANALKIYPRRKFVESLSRVTVESGGSKIHAQKFEADLATESVRFQSSEDSKVELLYQASF